MDIAAQLGLTLRRRDPSRRHYAVYGLNCGHEVTVQMKLLDRVAAGVIPPFLAGCIRRIHAAIFSFMAGVMPPMPMFGRSLL